MKKIIFSDLIFFKFFGTRFALTKPTFFSKLIISCKNQMKLKIWKNTYVYGKQKKVVGSVP